MSYAIKNGQTSVVLRVKLLDSSSTTGAGLTGLTSASSGLIIGTVADNEATSTAYTVTGSTIETITTLGTFAAPTATKCRFKEVDATNHKGLYELQIADARFAVSSAKSIIISILGATNLAQTDLIVRLVSDDPYVAKPTNSSLLSIDASGRVDVIKIAGTTQTARDIGASVLLSTGTGTGQLDFTSGVVKSNVTQLLGTAWLTPGTAGTPDVNAKLWNGLTTVALPLIPTTAGRTLDVSTGGEAGLDWANVGSPTTSLALTGTTIATTQKVDVETIKTNPVVNGGTITFPTTATLASTTNITAGTITTATNVTTVNGLAANVITATSIASDAITDAKVASDVTIASVTGAVGSVTGAVGSVTGAVGSVTGAVGSVTGLTASDVGAIKAKTDNLPSSPAAVGSAMTLTSGERNSVADALLNRDMSTGTDDGSTTVRTVRQALRFLRNKWSISGTTLTVCKEDDSTSSWTSVVTGTAGADPITANDPAGP